MPRNITTLRRNITMSPRDVISSTKCHNDMPPETYGGTVHCRRIYRASLIPVSLVSCLQVPFVLIDTAGEVDVRTSHTRTHTQCCGTSFSLSYALSCAKRLLPSSKLFLCNLMPTMSLRTPGSCSICLSCYSLLRAHRRTRVARMNRKATVVKSSLYWHTSSAF